ncbi:alpha/beta fold hydrolase [Herbidospora yilanensis]|uniref:alpha/beta fold hydrolase n=1 Tax=Herbidospora yilanensis TaxID=354426 RepID=UPI0007854D77|nr:alpha/beta hydrolase [Herbidospora yilanensis]
MTTLAGSPAPAGVHLETGGGDGPVVVFLHGSAASGAVWSDVVRELAARRPGIAWAVPDLPGHGRSRWQRDYSPDGYADAVAAALAPWLAGRPAHLVGHSLGGMVALALADGTRAVKAASALVIAMKVSWTETELTRRAAAATRPTRVFPTVEEARALFGRISGLSAPDALDTGLALTEGGHRLSGDPRITATPPAAPETLAAMAARAACPVRLACGDDDPGIRPADMGEVLGLPVDVLAGARHNVPIEQPGLVADLVLRTLPQG